MALARGQTHQLLRQAKQRTNILWIVERSQPCAVLLGEALLPGPDTANDPGHLVKMGLPDRHMMSCDRLERPGDVDHPGGLVGALLQQLGESLCEGIDRGQVGEAGERLGLPARQDDGGGKSMDLRRVRPAGNRPDGPQRAVR